MVSPWRRRLPVPKSSLMLRAFRTQSPGSKRVVVVDVVDVVVVVVVVVVVAVVVVVPPNPPLYHCFIYFKALQACSRKKPMPSRGHTLSCLISILFLSRLFSRSVFFVVRHTPGQDSCCTRDCRDGRCKLLLQSLANRS